MSAVVSEGPSFLRVVVGSCAAGVCAGAFVNAAWLAATGDVPSLWTSLALTQGVTTLWSVGQAIRFRRKWLAVVASFSLPALGEGIETPNRPPSDEEGDR
ncbi:hypothetical protein [Actinacidiphila sp. ITFR-21]|uniref:hypothetical protein n=1 Tax=Actinacidiphila sp. ITFR-21 TaxID=3075199 RepID=UPI00288BCF00|nr:hypothetical protein [Streptomyces sp. ITFR-21]WNI19120.1 hypothetical protein RLT57_28690 [Streptomyces sp. ITFR-21]